MTTGRVLWNTDSTQSYQDESLIAAELPNITGRFSFTDNNSTSMRVKVSEAYGAFYSTNYGCKFINSNGVPGSTTAPAVVDINANRQHNVYSSNSEFNNVHPPAIRVHMWRRIS